MTIPAETVFSAIAVLDALDPSQCDRIARLALDDFRDVGHPAANWREFDGLLVQHGLDRNRKEDLLVLGSRANARARLHERAVAEAGRARLEALGCAIRWGR